MIINTKICPSCKKNLLIECFNKSANRKDGLQCYCKQCGIDYRKKNKNKIANQHREYGEKHKEEINIYRLKYFKDSKLNPIFTDKPQGWFFQQTIRNAKRRKVLFTLTYEDFISNFTGECALSGRKLFCTKTYHQSVGNQNASPDRIDSSKGYEQGNLQWVDWEINHWKSNLPNGDFINMCGEVYLKNIN